MARTRRSQSKSDAPKPAPVTAPPPSVGDDTGAERWVLVLLPLVMAFLGVALWPEIASTVPTRNDHMFHQLMVRGASDAIANGHNPLDFWIPQLDLGFPQFLYYHHLPHLLLAIVHRAAFGVFSVETVFRACQFTLLVGMPITVYWSVRQLGYGRAAAALAGVVSVLFVSDNRMGLDYNSYVQRGFGLFSQLVAVHLTFVVIATLSRTLREGRGQVIAALALAALVLSHFVFGVMIVVVATLLVLLGAERSSDVTSRTIRLVVVGLLAAALCSYMLVPFVESSRAWMSTLPWIKDSESGNPVPLSQRVLSGELFDYGRLPVLSLFVIAGVVVAVVQRHVWARFAIGGLMVTTMLYLVRPDLGAFATLIPAHSGWVSYRFASVIGVFAVLVIAIAGEGLWRLLSRVPALRGPMRAMAFGLVVVLMLSPAIVERWKYFQEQREVVEETTAGVESARGLAEILAMTDTVPGRIFAGPVTNKACPMRVGPALCVSDLLNARGHATIGNPLQSISLPAGLIWNIKETDAAIYDLFDIRSVLIPRTASVPAFMMSPVVSGDFALYRVATSGIVQYVGVTARRATRRQDTLYFAQQAWLERGGAKTRQTERWDYPAALGAPANRRRCRGNPRTTREVVTSQTISVDVQCDDTTSDTLALQFKMAFHPHWQVTVDGTPVTPYLVSPGFLAIDLPSGAHRVDARYRPHPAKIPLLLAGLLIIGVAFVFRERLDAPARWLQRRETPVTA